MANVTLMLKTIMHAILHDYGVLVPSKQRLSYGLGCRR